MNKEEWLNGWERIGTIVRIGATIYCCGCGKYLGSTCTIVVKGEKYPNIPPDFPFDKNYCPICTENNDLLQSMTPEQLSEIDVGKLRKAMILAKTKS